jgi:2-polyprenyl-3-methyl-5-hydroxy-6-metoxy-1,4-benzoquinol methylase
MPAVLGAGRVSGQKGNRALGDDPLNNPNDALKHSWVANAEAWTRVIREDQIESRKLVTNAAIRDAVAIHPKGRVLDLGCGEGWLARDLSALGFDVTGIDGSAPLISAAQALGGGSFRSLSYEEIAADPDLLGDSYDYTVCNFSLLGENLTPLLAALRVSLQPEGLLFIQTLHPPTAAGLDPYRDGWKLETFTGMGDSFQAPMPWYFRTISSWWTALTQTGFEVVDVLEPVHPATGRPVSLLLCARRVR